MLRSLSACAPALLGLGTLLLAPGCASQPAKQEATEQPAADPGPAEAAPGRDYLRSYAGQAGAQRTASGLCYKVLAPGAGAKPGPLSTVRVHYTGRLIDGTVFDSSRERGEPISFPLNKVIKGWTEGLQLMPTGSRYELAIPFELAYGAKGYPPEIPPYSTLVFDVELLAIE